MKKELVFEAQEREYAKRHPKSSDVIVADRIARAKAKRRKEIAENASLAILATVIVCATFVCICAFG